MKEVYRTIAAFGILMVLAGLFGCATTEPDTAADIGKGVGRGFEVLAQTIPGVSGAMSTVDEFRAHRHTLHQRAEDRAVRERMWRQCVQNPCLYVDDCKELFPESFMVPACAGKSKAAVEPSAQPSQKEERNVLLERDVITTITDRTAVMVPEEARVETDVFTDTLALSGPENQHSTTQDVIDDIRIWLPNPPTLKERLKAVEGLKLREENSHIGFGHWVTPAEKAAGRFSGVLSLKEADELLDEDIAEARGEAIRVFGEDSDALVELCFFKACARLFGHVPRDELADAVRSNVRMNSIDANRTAYIADRL